MYVLNLTHYSLLFHSSLGGGNRRWGGYDGAGMMGQNLDQNQKNTVYAAVAQIQLPIHPS